MPFCFLGFIGQALFDNCLKKKNVGIQKTK